jgi:hypothetical protein
VSTKSSLLVLLSSTIKAFHIIYLPRLENAWLKKMLFLLLWAADALDFKFLGLALHHLPALDSFTRFSLSFLGHLIAVDPNRSENRERQYKEKYLDP